MKEDVLFKKTPFGGFDRVEVISYIHQLKSTQQKYKILLDEKEKSNAKLTRDLEDRMLQVEQLRKDIKENEKTVSELQIELAKLRDENEQLKNMPAQTHDGSEFVPETVKMCDELVETASETAKKLVGAAEDKLIDAQKRINKVIEKLENNDKTKPEDAKKLLKKLLKELK